MVRIVIKRIVLVGIITALVLGIIASEQFVFANDEKKLEKGKGIAVIAEGTGEFTCNDATKFQNVGVFILFSEDPTREFKIGPSGLGLSYLDGTEKMGAALISGNVKPDKYDVKGIVFDDDICLQPDTTVVTVSGNCGLDVTITVKTSTGDTGTFLGDVACA